VVLGGAINPEDCPPWLVVLAKAREALGIDPDYLGAEALFRPNHWPIDLRLRWRVSCCLFPRQHRRRARIAAEAIDRFISKSIR
jgi:hypothetical protein